MPNKAKQRFIDLAVGEVSVVDTPANEVEFLVLKRLEEDDPMTEKNAESKPTDQTVAKSDNKAAEVVTVETAKASDAAVNDAMAKVTALVEGIAKAAGAKPAATPAEDPEETKDAEVEKAAKGMGAKRKQMREQLKAAGMKGEDLTKAMSAFDKCCSVSASAEDTTKAAETPAPTPPAAEEDAAEVLASKALAHLGATLTDVAKAKTMTPKRQEALKTAISGLQKLLEETGAVSDPAATKTPADPKVDGVTELTKALTTSMAELTAQVTKALAETQETTKGIEARVAKVENERPAASALPTEETETKKAGRKSIWSGVL